MTTGYSSQFGGGRPIRTTTYTSGSGTHTILAASTFQRITIIGGGSGGSRPPVALTASNYYGGGGGAAGQRRQVIVQMSGAIPYSVGAAVTGASANNTAGTVGNASNFGPIKALGGAAPTVAGGASNTASQATGVLDASAFAGGGGGAGSYYDTIAPAFNAGFAGSAPGFHGANNGNGMATLGAASGNNPGGGGGGDSLMGQGGNGGAASAGTGSPGANATGYGAGGGGGGYGPTATGNGGNSSPGVIIVEEF